jgi:hypothetical protein
VATHEHRDHLCAFYNCQEQFKKFRVDNVWLAWTENPGDPLAQKIAKYKGDLGSAIAPAGQALARQSVSPGAAQLGAAIQDVFSFSGDPKTLTGLAPTVNEAMEFVRTKLTGKPKYHNPGEEVLEPAFAPGFRFYILGPPRSEEALQDTGEQGSASLYGLAATVKNGALMAAGAPAEAGVREQEMPFDPRFRMQAEDPLVADSLRDYLSTENSWRRVDCDWLHAAAELALQLDNLTNNTSLAMAIERVSDGKVFLFPADAQEGNWLSWHDPAMQWKVEEGPSTRVVTAADLLARTVFYKTGHHASHNATAKEKGLELMEREGELLAFIPVDRAVALTRHPEGCWSMPARPLYRRLLEKCQGRVVRADLGWADDSRNAANRSAEKEFDGLADGPTWSGWRASQAKVALTTTPLYFEVVL